MYHKSNAPISFSKEELWFLLGLFSPCPILGVENPYTGYLFEEIEKSERAALDTLISQDILLL